jgi:hypothetical protein
MAFRLQWRNDKRKVSVPWRDSECINRSLARGLSAFSEVASQTFTCPAYNQPILYIRIFETNLQLNSLLAQSHFGPSFMKFSSAVCHSCTTFPSTVLPSLLLFPFYAHSQNCAKQLFSSLGRSDRPHGTDRGPLYRRPLAGIVASNPAGVWYLCLVSVACCQLEVSFGLIICPGES